METYHFSIKDNILAIVKALTKWKQYLLDVTDKFKVWTDHENLKYFQESYKFNG